MQRIAYTILGCFATIISLAQPATLSITSNKTSTLIFPAAIRHVDLGNKNLLVQQVVEAEHILLLKAAQETFSETNLSVITVDGSVYSFGIKYETSPERLVHEIPALKATTVSYAKGIIDNKRLILGVRDYKWGIESILIGIYTNGSNIFYHLELKNHSSIVYDVDFIRFYIRYKKKVKRTANQEEEIAPSEVIGNDSEIAANQKNSIVITFPRFVIPDGKFLAIEIREKGGGRDLLMKVTNKKIIRAERLPDYK